MKTLFSVLCLLIPMNLVADVTWNGSDTLMFIRIDDTCQNVILNFTWTYRVNGGSPVSGSYNGWPTSRGNFGIGDIYPTPTPANIALSYTITPSSVSSTPYNYQNVGSQAFPNGYQSVGYSATTPNPCGSFPGENNILPLAVTNFTSLPLMLPDGNVLQPGQSTNWLWTPPLGGSNSVSFHTLNQNAQWQDGGGIQFTSGWNSSYPPQYVFGTNNLPFTTQPVDGNALGNGGNIVWDNTNTTAANNGTLQSGFSLLNNDMLAEQMAQNGEFSNLINRLSNPASPVPVSFTNQISFPGVTNIVNGASNVWVQNWPSNFLNASTNGSPSTNFGTSSNVWVMNFPTNIDTNTLITMVLSHTNQAYGVMNPVQADASSLLGNLPSSLGDVPGSPQEQDVRIGPSTAPITIPLGVIPPALSTPFNAMRGLIAWFIVVCLIIWNYKTLFDCFYRVMSVPQAQGADAGIFSQLGANAATAIVSAVLIVAIASALPVIAAGFLAGELSFLGGTSSPLNFFAVMGWAYQFLSQYIPIYTMFSAFGMRVVFYFGLRFFEMIGLAVVKLIVGL